MAVIIKGDNNGLAVDGDVKIEKLNFVFGEGVKSASGVSTVRADAEEVKYEEVAGEEEKLCNKENAAVPARELPEELQSKRARAMLDIAVQYGVLTSDYQKNAPVWQLGGVADKIGDLLGLPNKWVVFGELWDKKSDSLRKLWNEKKDTELRNKFTKKILNKIH